MSIKIKNVKNIIHENHEEKIKEIINYFIDSFYLESYKHYESIILDENGNEDYIVMTIGLNRKEHLLIVKTNNLKLIIKPFIQITIIGSVLWVQVFNKGREIFNNMIVKYSDKDKHSKEKFINLITNLYCSREEEKLCWKF